MSLTNLAVAAGHAISEWRRKRRAYAELMSLDDRTLADIGIRRSQIAGVVYGQPRPETAKPVTAAQSNHPRHAGTGLHRAA